MKITEKQWNSYRDVQDSGVTNMLNFKLVSQLTGLSRFQLMFIIRNYESLMKKYEGEK